MSQYRTYSSFLRDLTYQTTVKTETTASMEGATADRIIARFKDLVMTITRTILTNTRYFKDDFKRSEFQAYYDGHKNLISVFLRSPAYSLPSIPVLIPEGMVVPYPEAAPKINKLLHSYNLTEIYQAISHAMEIVDQFEVGKEAASLSALRSVLTDVSKYDMTIVDTQGDLKSIFVKEPHHYSPAIKAFVNKEGMASSINSVLGYNQVFKELGKVKQSIESVDVKLDQVVTRLEEKTKAGPMPADIVKIFSLILNTSGQAVDHYGLILHESQRLEHAFTAAINTVVKYGIR